HRARLWHGGHPGRGRARRAGADPDHRRGRRRAGVRPAVEPAHDVRGRAAGNGHVLTAMVVARVIIAFRENERPPPGRDALQRRWTGIAAAAGLAAPARRGRPPTGADLAVATPPLDASGIERLLGHARARGDVEFADADAMATIAGGSLADG